MFFAGEATHELYNGYVHGGYLTGVEQAKNIAKHVKTGSFNDENKAVI